MLKKILTSVLLAGILLCGCKPAQVSEETNLPAVEQTPGVTHEQKEEQVQTKIVGNNPPKDVTGWEPMGQYTMDFDGDDAEETITLYTSAQRDMRGDMMWDDAQWWVLEVTEGNKCRNLYDERIHGMVYMDVSEYYHDGESEKIVSLYISGNSSNEVREYRFDGENYTETVVYSTNKMATEGISTLYSSIPEYE